VFTFFVGRSVSYCNWPAGELEYDMIKSMIDDEDEGEDEGEDGTWTHTLFDVYVMQPNGPQSMGGFRGKQTAKKTQQTNTRTKKLRPKWESTGRKVKFDGGRMRTVYRHVGTGEERVRKRTVRVDGITHVSYIKFTLDAKKNRTPVA
jgi:hypothetical protein